MSGPTDEQVAPPRNHRQRGRVKPDHERLALPPAEWPAVDQHAWERLAAPGVAGLTMSELRARRNEKRNARDGRAQVGGQSRRRRRSPKSWSAERRQQHAFAYGLWLAFLRAQGALAGDVEPTSRITPELVNLFFAGLVGRCRASTVHTYVQRLLNVAKRLQARGDWVWLEDIVRDLAPPPPDPAGNLARVREPVALFALAEDLMQCGDALASAPRARTGRNGAVLYRDGLMLAVLVFAVIRRRSLLALEAGDTLQRAGDEYVIVLRATDTKGKRPEVIPLPMELTAAIERYETVHRPILLGRGTSSAFWISREGQALGGNGVWAAVCRHTLAAFGVRINPQFIRHCVATTEAIRYPEKVGTLPTLLQHRDIRVTERHYILVRALLAHERHQAAVAAERRAVVVEAECGH